MFWNFGHRDVNYVEKVHFELLEVSYQESILSTMERNLLDMTLFQNWVWGHFKNTYELLNLRALKFSPVNKIHIFQCMGKIFCVEFQRYPLKFHTQYPTHTLKDMFFLYNTEISRALRFKSSYMFLKRPRDHSSVDFELISHRVPHLQR